MEKLLNKLIEKGWKPRGIYTSLIVGYGLVRCEEYVGSPNNERKSYRELVSKESGLWQFCVENKLVIKYADLGPDEEEAYIGKWKSGLDAVDINGDYIRLDDDYDEYHQDTDYKYWLIECALKDEKYLEKFLLDNIKV